MLSKPKLGTGLAVVLLGCTPVVLLGLRYGFAGLLGHFSCDLYQPLADAFRVGQLSLSVDAAKVAIFDATLWRGDIYLSFPPFPAALYAVLDAFAALIGAGPFPKVALFVVLAVAHTLALFFLLLRLAPRGVTLAFLLTLSYILAFPLPNLAVYDVGASEVAALFTSTFVLLGALFWLRYRERPTMCSASAAGLLLGCACLGRPTAWAYAAALVVLTFALRRLRRDAICLAALTGGAIALFLVYNAARFGDSLSFGDSFSYTGVWEQAVDNHGVAPGTVGRAAARAGEAAQGWFGVNARTGADAWTLYVISEGGGQLIERTNLLLLGLLFGIVAWLRGIGRPGIELALLAAVLAHFAFMMLFFQSVTSRYVLDVWPAFFALSVAGLHQGVAAARERWARPWISKAFPVLILISLSFTFLGRHGRKTFNMLRPGWLHPLRSLSSEPVSNESLADPAADFCQGGIIRAQHGQPPAALSCQAVSPREDDSPPPGWVEQDDLYRLGIFRAAGGRCYMLYFAGVTLWQEPERSCRVELHLEPGAVTDCDKVELRLDGETLGPMSAGKGAAGADSTVCSRALPSHGGGPVQLFFLFGDGLERAQDVAGASGFARGRWCAYFGTFDDLKAPGKTPEIPAGHSKPLELREAGGRFAFHEVRVSCD